MATVASLSTCKSEVVAALQSNGIPSNWSTTVDGSNAQFSSDAEILNAILQSDAQICMAIINCLQHPYQTQFVQTTAALTTGTTGAVSLPARNGMILKVLCADFQPNLTFSSGNVSLTGYIDFSGSNGAFDSVLSTGIRVMFTTSGTLPSGISDTGVYTLYIPGNDISTVGICANAFQAASGTPITLGNTGSGSSTMIFLYEEGTQALSKDQIVSANSYPALYATNYPDMSRFWYIEGDTLYSTSYYSKVVYTDYTLTSTTQAPEPYLQAIVAGALADLYKDGGDSEMSGYYRSMFKDMLTSVSNMATVLPAISFYKIAA